MSIKSYQSYTMGRTIIYGTIAGIISGIVMLTIMTALMGMLKLPPTLFPMLLGMIAGQTGQAALITGISIHFVTSLVIGAIFGTVTSRISKLMINYFVKGVVFGIATGFIAFVVLYVPMSITLLPQNMMNLMNMMNPGMSSQVIMLQLQNIQPMILIGSLLSHLSFGIVLGIVVATIERTFTKRDHKGCAITTP